MNTYASDDCKPLIDASDKAIGQQQRLIDLKTQEIAVQDTIVKAQETKITELEKKTNLFNNPLTYVVLSVALGFYLGSRR